MTMGRHTTAWLYPFRTALPPSPSLPTMHGLSSSSPPVAGFSQHSSQFSTAMNASSFSPKFHSDVYRLSRHKTPFLVSSGGFFNIHPNLDLSEVEELLEPRERDILQHNAVPDISKISTKKWNLFHSLGLSLQIPLMDELLEQGWDINSVDKDGYTALHMAVIGKKEAVISHLLRKGANPHIRDQEGATALHYAVQAGAMQTVKLLIKYKVDVNVADNDGWTPLHISMQSRSRDVAKVLLVNGADKTRRTKDGKTPLDLSMCYGRDFKSYDLAKLLKLDLANRSI